MITRSIVLHHPRAFQLSLEVLHAPTEELLDASKALLAPFEIVLGLLEALSGPLPEAHQFPWRPALHLPHHGSHSSL